MKRKDRIIAFTVSLCALINSYILLKKFDDYIGNLTIKGKSNDSGITMVYEKEKNDIDIINVDNEKNNVNEKKFIEINNYDNINNNEDEFKENETKEEQKFNKIVFEQNFYGYVKNDTSMYSIDNEIIGDIEKYQLVTLDWETSTLYHGTSDGTNYAFFDKNDIEILPNKFVEVDIDSQTVNLYEDNKKIMTTGVTTGMENKYDTRLGYFYIYYKQYDTYLVGPGYKLHVNYWIPFDGGIGFHDAYWRSSFGNDVYKTNGSHGCVNMTDKAAEMLYENVEANTRVLVHK